MQTSAQGIILDQLQEISSATSGASTHISENDSTLNSLALLDTTLRELLPTSPLEHIARTLVEATRQALEMDLCVLLLPDGDDGHLTMQAASPDLNGQLLATAAALYRSCSVGEVTRHAGLLTRFERE